MIPSADFPITKMWIRWDSAWMFRNLDGLYFAPTHSNLRGSVRGALSVFAKCIEWDDVIMFHCTNHRLKLAVHDAVSSTNTRLIRLFLTCVDFAQYVTVTGLARPSDYCSMTVRIPKM